MKLQPTLLLLAGIACTSTAAHASDLTFSFQQDTPQASFGTASETLFSGTLTNASATDRIYLNADQFLFNSGPGITFTDVFPQDPTTFDPATQTYSANPGVPFDDPNHPSSPQDQGFSYLLPGQSLLIHNLFEIDTSASTPIGSYTGSYNFQGAEDTPGGHVDAAGNDTRDATDPLLTDRAGNSASVGFTVRVVAPAAVPETATLSLLGLGLLPVALIARRRRA